jgi:glycosyltransferase involved in cell wall biosynthesis
VELGHDVTVVAPVGAAQDGAREATAAVGIELITAARPPSRQREGLAALLRRPSLVPAAARLPVLAWQVEVFWTALRPLAQAALRDLEPDVLSVEHDNAARWAADLDHAPPAVLTLQNVGWHYYANRARAVSGPRRAAFRLEARRFRRHDLRHFDRYSMLGAVSDRDRADLLGASPRSRVEVVPNGVASDELTLIPEPEGPPVLLFTGTLNHPPNAEGIEWFADEAWPAIRARRPDASLLVVGREPPPSVTRLRARPGIEVVGPVPDMRDWYAKATAVVVPLLSGGGSRLKILEAIACGRAVASTSAGAEGLDLEDGRELVIADGAEAFAAATLRLLEGPDLRAELAAAGRRAAEERYDWRVLGDRLESVLASAAS